MKEKFLDKCKMWKDTPVEINKSKSFFNIFILLLSTILLLTTIIGGFNFLTMVMVVISCFIALAIFIQAVFKNKLNIFLLASYGVLVFGTAFAYITRGADSFGYRFGYNFGLSLIPIVTVTVLALIPKMKNTKVNFYLTRVTSFFMIVGSLIYCLFMNIRMKPTCASLWEGHDEYLNKIKNSDNRVSDQDPNVLVILMDDMAYSDISSYSYMGEDEATIKTPNLDKIGEKGIMMENCYASAPVSSPSRFSILTGRYSCRGYLDNVVFNTKQQNFPFSTTRFFNEFELRHNVDGILGDEITIAEAMQSYGYKTGLFGKWNLGDYGEYLPTNQGFDYFYGSHYINDMIPYNIVREEKGVFEEVISHNEKKDQSLSTENFTDELMQYMQTQVSNNEKFFLEYWSPWPHFPIFSNRNGNGKGDKTDDNYIDCIEEFDESIGSILNYLETTTDPRSIGGDKLIDNTLIIFTSDNGPGREGVTGNLRGRKNTPFEGAYKVPFMACLGDKLHSKDGLGNPTDTITARCINMDVYTTILDYAGILGKFGLPQDREIDGKSMRGLFEGTVAEDTNLHDSIYYFKRGKAKAISKEFETVHWIKDSATGKNIIETDTAGNAILKKQDFKFYKSVQTENSAFFNQIYKNYLFNLDSDQAEGYNVSMREENKQIVETLDNELKEFNKKIKNDKFRRGIKAI